MPHNRIKNLLQKLSSSYNEGAVFTAFDTETTGLNKLNDRIIEIGAVKFDKNGIIDSFSSLINPNIKLPRLCYELSGICDEMLVNEPTIDKILPDFYRFISNTRLIAHNANFDVNFINCEATRFNFPTLAKPCIPALDTVQISRFCFPDFENHKLQNLANIFSIDPGKAHRAYDDAVVCMEVFIRSLNKFQENFN